MKKKQITAGVLLSLALITANAVGIDWPKLVRGKNHPECKTAFRLAKSAYKSESFHLWEPQTLPKDLNATLVLGPQGLDLSGGNAIKANLEIFTKIPLLEDEQRSLYWQTKTNQKNRLVIEEMPHGWRGDAYAVRSVPKTLTTSEYFAATKNQGSEWLKTPIDGAWRTPLVFQRNNTENLWIVYVGEPYDFSPNWIVYLPVAGQLQEACKVQFRPNVKYATSLLPSSVQRLATLLDQSIGKGENEGTLQPTAQRRIDVDQVWANAALRPWAMGTPYNSRKEVDAGLLAQAKNGKSYQAAYVEIKAGYKIAEKALADYYQEQFNMPEIKAKSTAKIVLDVALRTHYVFHKPG
jgi:hypothetical protein